MFNYLATVEFIEDEGTYEISYCDFPDIQGVAYKEENIEFEAEETLISTIAELISSRLPIPLPTTTVADAFSVHLPVLTCLKIALNNAIIQSDTQKPDLARKLNLNALQIERLLDIRYASKVEILEQALYLLNFDIAITVIKRSFKE